MNEPQPDGLTLLRQELAGLLASATSSPAVAHLPGKLTPPVSIVQPGTPYVVPGDTFASFQVRLKATIVLRNKANEVITTELDNLITECIVAVVNGGFAVDSVSEPFALESGGSQFFAAELITIKTITL